MTERTQVLKALRERRSSCGFTSKSLAQRMGLTERAMRAYEYGKTPFPPEVLGVYMGTTGAQLEQGEIEELCRRPKMGRPRLSAEPHKQCAFSLSEEEVSALASLSQQLGVPRSRLVGALLLAAQREHTAPPAQGLTDEQALALRHVATSLGQTTSEVLDSLLVIALTQLERVSSQAPGSAPAGTSDQP